MGLLTLWENYLPWTQAVVVAPLIARARSSWLKALWYAVLFSTTVAFTVQTYYQFKDYFSYQKTTNVRLQYEPQAPFPAVTFCNLNPFKKSMVPHSQELTNLLAAYTYVNKVKEARMKSGAAAVATTTMTGSAEPQVRRKRQATALPPESAKCNDTQYPYNDGSPKAESYNVWECADGTAFMVFQACADDRRLMTNFFTPDTTTSWKDDMATIFYECFHSFCDKDCSAYQDGLNAMVAVRECLKRKPAYTALAGIVAQALAGHCNYDDAICSVAMAEKTGSEYGGFYYHRECGPVITTVFEDCNVLPEIGVNYTHSYDNTCDKDQYVTERSVQWAELQRLAMRSVHVQCVDDLIVHVQHDADHDARYDGGDDDNRFAKPLHDAGNYYDFISQHAGNYNYSFDIDYGAADWNYRRSNH